MGDMSNTRYLVVKGSGGAGLGDKLRALISAVAYARLSGRRLYVDWNDPAYGDGRNNYFGDLFKLEGVESVDEMPLAGSVRPPSWQGKLHLNWDQLYAEFGSPPWDRRWAQETFSFDQGNLDWPDETCVMWDFDQFSKLAPLLPRLYSDFPAGGVNEVQQGYILRRHIRPSSVVQDEMQSYSSKLGTMRPFIGVHVRASAESFIARNTPPVSAYVKSVMRIMQTKSVSTIFLATDNHDVQKVFEKKFGDDRVIFTDKWLPPAGVALHLKNDCPDRLQSAKDALVDVLLLASADYLVTMGNSSFGMLARMFSASPLENRATLMWKAPFRQRILRALVR